MRVKPNKRVNIEYYVPTHELGRQVEDDTRQAFNEKADRIESVTNQVASVDVRVIRGRDNQTPDGIAMCRKVSEAAALNRLGKSVEFLLCNNGTEQCEFFDKCLYFQK